MMKPGPKRAPRLPRGNDRDRRATGRRVARETVPRSSAAVAVRRRDIVRISDEAAKAIWAGHPIVYRDAISHGPAVETGEVVEVYSSRGDLLGRGLYDATGHVAVRVLVRGDRPQPIDGQLIRARIAEAKALRERLFPRELTVLRLLNGEGDGLAGATCDRYGAYLVVQLYTAAWQRLEPSLLDALQELYEPAGIYLQRRYLPASPEAPRPGAEHVRGQTAPIEIEVVEAGLRFGVDVTAPLSPGLFPDLRDGRLLVQANSSGRRVLNLFSFTGAFTVHAMRGGAIESTSVDLSTRSHARARQNLERNDLANTKCEFLAGDAVAILAQLGSRGRRFDLAVLDPPTFAAGKGRPFSVARDYSELIRGALELLDDGGLLAAAANTHSMTTAEFERACAEGGAAAGATLRVLTRRGLPEDFPTLAAAPETNYLKFMLLAKMI